jgi:hypothetical protein
VARAVLRPPRSQTINCKSLPALLPLPSLTISAQTRITTRYSLRPAKASRPRDAENLPDAPPPRARLVLKTYDPVSGACLKYKTSKAAEVGRLVAMLGRLGRRMGGLPDEEEGQQQPAVEERAETPRTEAPAGGQKTAAAGGVAGGAAGGAGAGGGKSKKKKGKR